MIRLVLGFSFTALTLPALGLLSSKDFSVYVAITTIPATLVFGLPAFLWMKRKDWLVWWAFLLAGLIGGIICAGCWVAVIGEPTGLITGIPFMGALGVIHSMAFWLISIWRNPGLAVGQNFKRVGA